MFICFVSEHYLKNNQWLQGVKQIQGSKKHHILLFKFSNVELWSGMNE